MGVSQQACLQIPTCRRLLDPSTSRVPSLPGGQVPPSRANPRDRQASSPQRPRQPSLCRHRRRAASRASQSPYCRPPVTTYPRALPRAQETFSAMANAGPVRSPRGPLHVLALQAAPCRPGISIIRRPQSRRPRGRRCSVAPRCGRPKASSGASGVSCRPRCGQSPEMAHSPPFCRRPARKNGPAFQALR